MSNKKGRKLISPKEKYKERDILANRYDIIKIYKGGMGIVYICYDNEKNKIIALKTFQRRYIQSERIKNAFKREALAWIHLEQHPFIVRAEYVFIINEQPHIALEYIAPDKKDRNTLSHHIKSGISLEQALIWGIQFCHGMEYAAIKGVSVHRDIKPDNIMVTFDGNVKITDFGIAKLWDEEETKPDWEEYKLKGTAGLTFLHATSSGGLPVGSIPWMAPEQFEGKTDKRSDIYSFGIVLYQMVTGAHPYPRDTAKEYYNAHLHQEIEEFDSKLYPIIKKCLAKPLIHRYQNFKELRLDLEALFEAIKGEKAPSIPSKKDLQAWEIMNKGMSFYALGFLDEALKTLLEVLKLKIDYAECYHQIGRIYVEKKLFDEGIEQFRKALKLKPYHTETRYNLAEALEETSKIKDAIEEYKYILNINKKEARAHYRLGNAYEMAGDFTNAMNVYNNFLKYAPKKEKKYRKLINGQIQGLKKYKETKVEIKKIQTKDKIIIETYQKTKKRIDAEKKKLETKELMKKK